MTLLQKSGPCCAVAAGLAITLAISAPAQQPTTLKATHPITVTHASQLPPHISGPEPPVVRDPAVPPFHAKPPITPLPPTLPASDFNDPRVQTAYEMAAKIKNVLYQEPCFCGCNKTLGHTSLYDCFAGTHASICETCLMEGIFVYLQTKKGQTPVQIRAEMIQGKWKSVHLNEFLNPGRY
ncbi:MAG: PCYCGC motif-containing (lipo)protein [Terriglobales bacterium]